MPAFPARFVVGDTVSFVQKQRPFLFPFFAHVWHRHHLHKFFTHANRRGYVLPVSPIAVSICLPPSSAALLRSLSAGKRSSQGHIPIGRSFRFQRTRGKSSLHLFAQGVPDCTPIFAAVRKISFTYLDKGVEMDTQICCREKNSSHLFPQRFVFWTPYFRKFLSFVPTERAEIQPLCEGFFKLSPHSFGQRSGFAPPVFQSFFCEKQKSARCYSNA